MLAIAMMMIAIEVYLCMNISTLRKLLEIDESAQRETKAIKDQEGLDAPTTEGILKGIKTAHSMRMQKEIGLVALSALLGVSWVYFVLTVCLFFTSMWPVGAVILTLVAVRYCLDSYDRKWYIKNIVTIQILDTLVCLSVILKFMVIT